MYNETTSVNTSEKVTTEYGALNDKITALSKQLNSIVADRKPQPSSRNNFHESGHSPTQKQNHNSTYPRSPFYGTCFACNRRGHRYTECNSASADKITDIKNNMPKYKDQRQVRINNSKRSEIPLNSQGSTTNPQ